MAQNYYLLNGQNGEGHTLDLLVDGELKRDFIDISSLDLKTMEIPREEAKDVLKEYNPDTNLDGMFYDALYPYKKVETKTFAPIFGFTGEEYKYYMDHLKYFAEQRDFKKRNGDKIGLDDNATYDKYVRTIMYRILRNRNSKLEQYESIIAKELKNIITERYSKPNKSTESYINSRIYKIKSILSGYTQIRDITLEQMLSIGGEKLVYRSDINRASHFDNYGMEPRTGNFNKENENSDKVIKYYQMTLDDYIDLKPKKK